MSPRPHVLYLHGFRSSPLSAKAQFLTAWFAQHHPDAVWCCPQLPASPQQSATLIHKLVNDWPEHNIMVIGSSLGGFYATWLAAQRPCKAVLLNPAVYPARDLAQYIGEQSVWQNPADKIFFNPEYIDELNALYSGEGSALQTDATHMLAIIATGDEVLDWQEMAKRYSKAQQYIIQGSDHGLSDFEVHWPMVQRFLGLE